MIAGIRLSIGLAVLVVLACAAAVPAHASNPADTGTIYVSPCWFQGASWFSSGPDSGTSNTNRAGGVCTSYGHVHAYFWNGGWNYLEATGYISASPVSVYWPYWTNHVYGYHEYPVGSNQRTSDAY